VRPRTLPRHAGFTLLEVVVTLGILGIVLAIVYGVFAQTVAGKQHAERRGDEAAAVRSALLRLTRDLRSARPLAIRQPQSVLRGSEPSPTATPSGLIPQRGLFLARPHGERGYALDDLAFTAFLHRPTAATIGATDLGIVHYFVAPVSGDSNERALYRETVFSLTGDRFDPDRPQPANTALILPGVVRFEVRSFDGTDWLPEWNSLDPGKFAPAPYAVALTLAVASEGDQTESFETAVEVPMAQGLRTPRVAVPALPGR
jgi:prepilin-type N-terminal cleavage/methylation domain-containing protein